MKILITGAGGFIGKNLLLGLSPRHQLLAVDRSAEPENFINKQRLANVDTAVCDLTDDEAVRILARRWGEEQDAVVHLAGNGDPAYSVGHPREDLRDSAMGLLNFLTSFRVRRLVSFSSGAVYDGLSGAVAPKSRVDPRLPYAISKLASEGYVKFFQGTGRVQEYVIVRFFGAYGPYEPPRKIYTRLARSFGLEGRSEFVIRGDGKNLIDAMFVDDAVRAVEKMVTGPGKNTVVDLCVGKPLTVRGLVEAAARVFGTKARIVSRGQVPEYITFRPSAVRMKRLFGFVPRVPLAEGLRILRDHLAAEDKITNYK